MPSSRIFLFLFLYKSLFAAYHCITCNPSINMPLKHHPKFAADDIFKFCPCFKKPCFKNDLILYMNNLSANDSHETSSLIFRKIKKNCKICSLLKLKFTAFCPLNLQVCLLKCQVSIYLNNLHKMSIKPHYTGKIYMNDKPHYTENIYIKGQASLYQNYSHEISSLTILKIFT